MTAHPDKYDRPHAAPGPFCARCDHIEELHVYMSHEFEVQTAPAPTGVYLASIRMGEE